MTLLSPGLLRQRGTRQSAVSFHPAFQPCPLGSPYGGSSESGWSALQEAVGDCIPVLLLGNKIDNEKEREVPRGLGEQLAKENNLIFYECSAYSGHNTKESLLHLARILKEQEDTVREDTVQINRPAKKKSCCG
uniref:Calcium release activated channel regulator 2A n=1 Tax=Molossus molossus TaxID=27622 RepID=A0A7J8FWN5_MOLMO|nr:calcium release activated channel regulator 2A [Molossus molossus]